MVSLPAGLHGDDASAAPTLHPAAQSDAPVVLRDVDLRGGHFAHASLRDVDLQRANLSEADLSGADLRGARLHLCDLSLADLRGADLRGADLSRADLSGADLRQADLAGADVADAELAWSWIDGVRGAPDAWLQLRRSGGRVTGSHRAAGEDEPIEGLRAFQRGQAAWKEGRALAAERAFRTALRWVPDSDAAPYWLGCLALEQGHPDDAQAWWQRALAGHPRADRARLDLALLWARADRWADVVALLAEPAVLAVDWLGPMAAAAQDADLAALAELVQAKAGETPGVKWARKPALAPAPPRTAATENQQDDPQWQAREREALQALFSGAAQPAWVWHGAISRALAIGDIDLAQRAEQRLRRVSPDQRLWDLQLKHLDLTAQAFAELVRTRWGNLGAVRSLRWVALGAHGPTARLVTDSGVFYAKRYNGLTRPTPSVAFTHRAARFASERGFLVPVAVPDDAGDDGMPFAGDLLALYPDVQGASLDGPDLDPAGAERMGAVLARLHLAGLGFGGSGRPRGGIRAGTRVLRHPSPRGAWLTLLGQDAACAAAFQRHALGERILGLLDATARRLRPVLAECPTGLVHGDFAGGNVLLRRDGALSVVDWDLCDHDVLAWDLARCADLLAVQWSTDAAAPLVVRPDLLRAVVAGYASVRSLSAAEWSALPLLVAASRVDLDASVLPLCVRLEPESGDVVWKLQATRLARAAAGAPEVGRVLAHR
ncbi:MAG: pentapeptide repeat-containing protein [Deltaproteobacteria bacterium]|nr:pentapeptide repeat-containing protein [Deltaproteobacteria bacterium]